MNTSSPRNLKPISLYLAIVFALSGIYYFLILYSGTLSAGRGMYVMGIMWCPAIAALITTRLLKRDVATLGWKWGQTKYQVWSYLIPILYALISYLVVWIAGWGGFYNKEFVEGLTKSFGLGAIGDGFTIALYVLFAGTLGTIRSCASALGEEIGWRGFLTPELYKQYGFTTASFVTGLIWGIWHLPILIFGDYNSGTPYWFAMPCFMVLIVSMSFVYTWFRIKSGSLWTAVLLHATHNLYIQAIFTPLTADTGKTAYYIDEFGIVLPVVSVFFAIYFWRRRKELEPVSA